MRLARFFRTNERFWLNLQTEHALHQAQIRWPGKLIPCGVMELLWCRNRVGNKSAFVQAPAGTWLRDYLFLTKRQPIILH